jgi:hypothetical protein
MGAGQLISFGIYVGELHRHTVLKIVMAIASNDKVEINVVVELSVCRPDGYSWM